MPAALRHQVEAGDKLWARFISLFISPPVVWAIWIVLIAQQFSRSPFEATFFASLFALTICILPMAFVAYMVKIGRISDMHMRHSHERYIPYSIAIVGCLLTELVYLHFGANPVLVVVALVTIVELTVMLIGTFFSHISLHAMAMTSIISATTIVYGFNKSLIFIPVLLLVILARLALRRHTAWQIVLGALIGACTPLAVIAGLSLAIP
ncbi:MAG: hypothetical protein OXN94_03965 [Chloroflexota bacterium]|nr:hypothetical protein [Chloroflexota bacterium]MDE2951979.1 hypothetical protein [Chloroflexota bacterium]